MRARMILALAIVATAITNASAQVADHLKCYSVKDPAVKALYTADLVGLVPEPGCQIKVPAKMVCVPTPKTAVSPAPPEKVEGGPATMMVCYKVKCAKAVLPPVPVADQFGSRTLAAKVAKLLCAPASVPPTTTTAISTTTTISITTTTSTTVPLGPCSSAKYPTCGGSCPGGQVCQAQVTISYPGGLCQVEPVPTSPECGCVNATTACASNTCPPSFGTCPAGQVCAKAACLDQITSSAYCESVCGLP